MHPFRAPLFRSICLILLAVGASASARAAVQEPVYVKNDYGGKRTDFTGNGWKGFVIEPTRAASEGRKPWVWYAPTIKRHPADTLTWLMQHLLAKGYSVCGVDVGENFDSPASRILFDDFYRTVVGRYGLDTKACLLGQSRGGLNHYLFAARHPEWVRCIAGIYAVADLRSYPGLAKAAAAYGMSEGDLSAHLALHNPIDNLEPIARAGVPIFLLHGNADTTVPIDMNSRVVLSRYRALGGPIQLAVIDGEGHSESVKFFQSQALLDFLGSGGQIYPTSP